MRQPAIVLKYYLLFPNRCLQIQIAHRPTTMSHGKADDIGPAESGPGHFRGGGLSSARYGVAAEFCHSLKLCP